MNSTSAHYLLRVASFHFSSSFITQYFKSPRLTLAQGFLASHSQGGSDGSVRQSCKCNYVDITKMPGPHADTARVMPGAHAHIAHTVCVKPGSHADTVCVKPGPHADINLKSKLWLACSRELMSCVGRLCKDYLYLLNSTTQRQLSATNPNSTTHNGSQHRSG